VSTTTQVGHTPGPSYEYTALYREVEALRTLNAEMLDALRISVAAPGFHNGRSYSQLDARQIARAAIAKATNG
jgi:hypothetical protein